MTYGALITTATVRGKRIRRLRPGLVQNANTFFNHEADKRVVQLLTTAHIPAGNSFKAHTIENRIVTLTTAERVENINTFFGHEIENVAPPIDLIAAFVQNANTFYDHEAELYALVPAYTNVGGQGDRTGTIGVEFRRVATGNLITPGGGAALNLVNGVDTGSAGVWYSSFAPSLPSRLIFDFGAPVLITEAQWNQSSTAVHSTVARWEGSATGNAAVDADWTTIGGTFGLGGVNGWQTQTSLAGNTSLYRYYALWVDAWNSGPWNREIIFKIAGLD